MAKPEKSNAQMLVPNQAGAMAAFEDRRFEKGWPIEVFVPDEHWEHWLQHVEFECRIRKWQCIRFDQLGVSGTLTIRTLPADPSPELVIRWERRDHKPMKVRARLAGTPELSRSEADNFFSAVQESCRIGRKERFHCYGQLHYFGLPWKGEVWLEDALRLGPASHVGNDSVEGFQLKYGPRVILVNGEIDAIDQEAALLIFKRRLVELAIFLSVVMRVAVNVAAETSRRAWTWTKESNGQIGCDVRFLGYVDPSPIREMPKKGRVPSIPLRPVIRPDLSFPGASDFGVTEQWLPDDVVELWKLVMGLPSERRQQFYQAGNQWRLALLFAHESITDSHAKMVVACESLKPAGEPYDYHNMFDVVEALWGKDFADSLRSHPVSPQGVRNEYFHRGKLYGEELNPHSVLSSFQDPSFQLTHLTFRNIPPAAILDWLRLGGNLCMAPKQAGWKSKDYIRPTLIGFLALLWTGSLVLVWLVLRSW
jgi:hypothetical protein